MKELLILLCKYPYLESGRNKMSQLLMEVKDWEKLVYLLNAHGIIALSAYNIKKAGLDGIIPREVWSKIENGMMQNIVRNTWLTEQWKELASILNGAGIDYILLKGMALEHTLYESKGLRQMNDIDILIQKENALQAWQLLKENGFVSKTLKSSLYEMILGEIDKHLPTLFRNELAVEIHTRLFDSLTYKSAEENPFKNQIEIKIDNRKALILNNKMHLSYLVSHYKRHELAGICQMRLFADIRSIDRDNQIIFRNEFLYEPFQSKKIKYRSSVYKAKLKFVPGRYRFRYIVGDIFPSLAWMKEHYKCNTFYAMIYYFFRIGKLLWLIP